MFLSKKEQERLFKETDKLVDKIIDDPCVMSLYNTLKWEMIDFIKENKYTYKEIEQIGIMITEAMLKNMNFGNNLDERELIVYSLLFVLGKKLTKLNYIKNNTQE